MNPFDLMKKSHYQTPRVSRLYLQLRSKFAMSYLIMVLIPFMLFTAVSFFNFRAVLEENIVKSSEKTLRYSTRALYRLFDELAAGAVAVLSDSMLMLSLENALMDNYNPTIAAKLEGAYLVTGDVVEAAWQKEDKTPVFNNPSLQKWYTIAAENRTSAHIHGTGQRFYSKGENSLVFSVALYAGKSDADGSPSILLVDFDYRLLEDIMKPVQEAFGAEEMILTNIDNTVMYSTDPAALALPLDSIILEGVRNQKNGLISLDTGRTKRLLTYLTTEDRNWTLISLFPAKTVTQGLFAFKNPAVKACLIICPILLLLYFAVASIHLKPINELTAVISGYERSTNPRSFFNTDSENGHHSDGNSSSEVNYLINKVYDIRLKQKEAELNSLQNQINPHFLYNTLESIRGAALYNGIHEIAAMSKALSLLFRYSISDKALVTIKEELGHLENYMSIQNFRYENRFELILNIPPEFYSYQILKLTLQPLIENSIKHGLEMKLGKGTIKIDIITLNKNIKIQVSDNGIGMPPKKIEELNKSLSAGNTGKESPENAQHSSAGIGVRNVNSRIKLYFGEQYGLSFKEAYAGTVVELILPVVKED